MLQSKQSCRYSKMIFQLSRDTEIFSISSGFAQNRSFPKRYALMLPEIDTIPEKEAIVVF